MAGNVARDYTLESVQAPRHHQHQLTQIIQEADSHTRQRVEKALDQRSEDPRFAMVMSWILLRRGRAKEAVQLLEKLALLNPEEPDLFRTFAIALRQNGENQLAKEVSAYADDIAASVAEEEPPPPGLWESEPTVFEPDLSSSIEQRAKRSGIYDGYARSELENPSEADGDDDLPLLDVEPTLLSSGSKSPVPISDPELAVQQPFAFKTNAFDNASVNPNDVFESGTELATRKESNNNRVWQSLVIAWALMVVASFLYLALDHVQGLTLLASPAPNPDQLKEAWQEGDLGRAAKLVPPEDRVPVVGASGPHKEALLPVMQAVLYRFHDADSRRQASVKRWLNNSVHPEEPVLVKSVLAPTVNRLRWLDGLSGAAAGPLEMWLVAATQHRAGMNLGSRDTLERLLEHESVPPFILASVAQHYDHTNQAEELQRLAQRMNQNAPDSPWTELVKLRVRLRNTRHPDRVYRRESFVGAPPVVQAQAALARADYALRQRRLEPARPFLDHAVRTGGAQAGLFIDHIDSLIARGLVGAARYLLQSVGLEDHPDNREHLEGMLFYKEGRREQARDRLLASWESGIIEPRSGAMLGRLLSQGRRRDVPPREVLSVLKERWPEHPELILSEAAWLLNQRRFGDAYALMADQIPWYRRNGSNTARADAYFLLARAAQGRGARREAWDLTAQALRHEPGHRGARKMLRHLRRRR